jgi:hypothetical protein
MEKRCIMYSITLFIFFYCQVNIILLDTLMYCDERANMYELGFTYVIYRAPIVTMESHVI